MRQVWEFKLLAKYDENGDAIEWQVLADNKPSWGVKWEDDDFPETAPEAMARYFELWDTDEVTI